MADETYRSISCEQYDCLKCLDPDCRCTCHVLENVCELDVCDFIDLGVREDWCGIRPDAIPTRETGRPTAEAAATIARAIVPRADDEQHAPSESQTVATQAVDTEAALPDPRCEFDCVEVSDLISAGLFGEPEAGIRPGEPPGRMQ